MCGPENQHVHDWQSFIDAGDPVEDDAEDTDASVLTGRVTVSAARATPSCALLLTILENIFPTAGINSYSKGSSIEFSSYSNRGMLPDLLSTFHAGDCTCWTYYFFPSTGRPITFFKLIYAQDI